MRRLVLLVVVLTIGLAGVPAVPAAAQAGGPRPCAAAGVGDPEDNARLDVVRLAAEWRCETGALVFTLLTRDAYTVADVSEVFIRVDSDGNLANGCSEGDYLLYGVNPPDGVESILGSVYRTPDCNTLDRIGDLGFVITGGTKLTVDVPLSLLGSPGRIAAYSQLEATGEDRTAADFAPDTGSVLVDTTDLADPDSVGVCIADDLDDVVRRGAGGGDSIIDAPQFDVTEICGYWGQHLAFDVTIPGLDIRRAGASTRLTVLINTEGDSTAERLVIAEWDGVAWSVQVDDAVGEPISGCDAGRVLVTSTMVRVGEMDPDCLGTSTAVGMSPGWGRADSSGGVTFDRAGASAYTPLRRAAALDAANTGARPDPTSVTSPADAPQSDEVQRLAGPARVETSIEISQDAWPDGAAAAVLARQDVEADALAGAALASAVGGPLLLTRSSQVPNSVAGELRRILQPGARVYVLGGPAAIDDQVLVDVQQLGFGAQRLAGEDRFETAAAIATEAATFLDSLDQIFIADGLEFQWALIAGAAAGAGGGVVLTTVSGGLADQAQAFVDANPDVPLTAIGPRATTAVPEARSIDDGGDPYGTSVLVAQEFFGGQADLRVVVASGESFPDGLGGGAFAGLLGGPLLLSPQSQLPTQVANFISGASVADVHMLGGPVALSMDVESALRQAVG